MLQTQTQDGIREITMDRADRGNALSAELVDALLDAVNTANADAELHTLVLRGAGRNFCTGFDLSDLDQSSDGDLLLRFVRVEQLLGALWHSSLRTVSIAQGRAWGAGADLFACCDHRIAAPDASFRFPGAGFGLVLGTRRLSERVGPDQARRWIIEGVQVDAQTAQAAGMATQITDAQDTMTALLAARPAIARDTAAAIRVATRPDHRAADLSRLVESAAAPGLRQRVVDYRDAMRGASGKR